MARSLWLKRSLTPGTLTEAKLRVRACVGLQIAKDLDCVGCSAPLTLFQSCREQKGKSRQVTMSDAAEKCKTVDAVCFMESILRRPIAAFASRARGIGRGRRAKAQARDTGEIEKGLRPTCL